MRTREHKPLFDVKAVVFDYGNTLVEFGQRQVMELNSALSSLVTEWFGPCDPTRFSEIRRRQIVAPYATDEFIENDREGICVELIEELYGVAPSAAQIQRMLEVKHESFVNAISLPDFVRPLLDQIRETRVLGFISNYPCHQSIVDSLMKVGIMEYFDSIVVSGEIGVVKPHPKVFTRLLDELELEPEECVYVGDNWLADIQGAKRIGMKAVHTTQYVSYEKFEPFDGDFQPDAVVTHLTQLANLLP